MKKIFTISALLIAAVLFLSGCYKRSHYDEENFWLSKESGVVVYSDDYCPYYVLETDNGYTILRSNGYRPYEGDVIYGDLSYRGYRDFYNYSDNSVFQSQITDFWLSYADAQYLIDNLCYSYSKSGHKAISVDVKKNLPVSTKQ